MTKKFCIETASRKAIARERKRLLAQAKEYERKAKTDSFYADWAKENRTTAADPDLKAPFSLDWRPRLGVFKGCNGKLTFDPVERVGYSYFNGYEIVKEIDGIVILNTYGYSTTTSMHVGVIRSLLEELGIKYQEIQAPKGLQYLNRALEEHVYLLATSTVRAKYARNPDKFKPSVQYNLKALALLEKLGHKASQAMHNNATACAEMSRTNSLAEARRKSALRKLEVIVDTVGEHIDRVGYHVYTGTNYIPYQMKYDLEIQSVDKGYKAIFIHVEPVRAVTARITGQEMEVSVSEVLTHDGE